MTAITFSSLLQRVTPILIGLVIFTILGLVKDKSKVFSLFGLAIGALILFVGLKDAADSVKLDEIEYRSECFECDLNYANITGGTDKVKTIRGVWTETITAPGDEFIHLSAQYGKVTSGVTATISVNGKIVETETSSGRFATASVSCNSKDVNQY